MASCKLTMIGLYNFDNTLFDGLTLPDGIDRETAINEFLMKCGEFEVNYPNIDFMKMAITHWGKKHYRTFEKWVQALAIEFEPLYNYDRYEEYEDERKKSNKSDSSATSKTDTTSTNDVTLSHDVSAYDSNSYQPRDKEITDGESTVKGEGESSTKANEDENENIKHKAHLYGNIGVTTSTQMLEDYIRVERFNIYEQMADIFVDEFCIMVYE